MVGFDLIFGGLFAISMGLVFVYNADRLASWYSRLWFFKWYEDWWGLDENWARFFYIIGGRFFIAFGVSAILWFIPINLHIVHWPKY